MWNSFSTSDGNKIGKEELSLKLTRVENMENGLGGFTFSCYFGSMDEHYSSVYLIEGILQRRVLLLWIII